MGRPIDNERKGCESSIHDHDIDLCVTMIRWADVPDSDWGDFRRRRAVDISSSSQMICENCMAIMGLVETLSAVLHQNIVLNFPYKLN